MWWVCVSPWWFLVCWESQRVFSFCSSDPLISLIRIFVIFGSYNTQRIGLVAWSVSAVFIMLGPFSCKLEAFRIQAHVPKELVGLAHACCDIISSAVSILCAPSDPGRWESSIFFHQWGQHLADSHRHRLMCLKTVRGHHGRNHSFCTLMYFLLNWLLCAYINSILTFPEV